MTIALLGASTRQKSFEDSLEIVKETQDQIKQEELLKENEEVGYFESWWIGKIPIKTENKIDGVIVSEPEISLEMDDFHGELKIITRETNYKTDVRSEQFMKEPSFWQRFLRVFGWEQR